MITRPDSTKKIILLAPMAGVTDKPFREICRGLGADACVSEMISSDVTLYKSRKSVYRRDFEGERSPRIVQIAGADPARMSVAAGMNIDNGAEIIDINMGCPAKKVCNVMAGSWLLRDEPLVGRILEQVVKTATVPVTLKIRTGWDNTRKNAVKIAKIARESGVKRVCVHGRTRACRFSGRAEHDTTAEIKSEVSIEVIANGDIGSAAEAVRVLQYTGADGIMIGRAAVGNPWLFRRIRDYLDRGVTVDPPTQGEISNTVTSHLQGIYDHYGEYTGVRVARKHISKYCSRIQGFDKVRPYIIREENSDSQMRYVRDFLAAADVMDMAA